MKLILSIIVICLTVFSSQAQNLIPFSEKEGDITKWGLKDKTGKIIVPPTYEYVKPEFKEGLAKVMIHKKYGFIDTTGKLVIPCIYYTVGNFSDGLAIAGDTTSLLVGFINKTGKTVIPFKYAGALDFSEGLALVINKLGKIGYVDKTGKVIIPLIYASGDNFKNGRTRVYKDIEDDYNDGIIIDKTGKIIR